MGFFDILKREKSASPIEEKNGVHTCAMCKREISESETHWILSHRYCAKCASSSRKCKAAMERLEKQKAAEQKKQAPKAPAVAAVQKSASVPIPAREIAPTPPECFLPYISDAELILFDN